ncbi:hypothetical protein ACFRKB_11355 [Streptomyces scopuliridis]|uniref:hypothetical protein n=1 Tax=Streptomyces scopuliridis TaxID=452529 RepID=UPI003699131E
MNGPWHYAEAERLLELAGHLDGDAAEIYAEAQVHATLALAAATAEQPSTAPKGSALRRAWARLFGPYPKGPYVTDRAR